MAAHMRTMFGLSGVFEKSRILRKECAVAPCLILSRYLCSSPDKSSSSPKTSQKSVDEPEAEPNQPISVVEPETVPNEPIVTVTVKGGFFKGYRLPSLISPPAEDEQSAASFAKLFRDSNFVHLGNPYGKIVIGVIYKIIRDDMYVDFDWKFPCVVKLPDEDQHLYVVNALVRLKILDLEMSTIFLGAEKETSLNEASCILHALHFSPLGTPRNVHRYE